ncbi:ROK family transcriptional regulator [Enteractinococcus helveticum]|nr:ROK family transcriptional regulator [Enteractinococcus helveticum]
MTTVSSTYKSQLRSSAVLRSGELLNLIRQRGPCTISELSEAMELARSTVTSRVKILLDADLILESRSTASGKGRSAAAYEFNPNAGVVLTVQIGITASRAAVTNLDGHLLGSAMIEAKTSSGQIQVMQEIVQAFRQLLENNSTRGKRLYGIGVGLPNLLELRQVLNTSRDLPTGSAWSLEELSTALVEEFDVPVFVDHDVNLIALAEYHMQSPRPEVLISVKAGTVISCGILVGGDIVRGRQDMTGEIGHTMIEGSDALCNCGNRGCLNAVAGGRVLAEVLREKGFEADSVQDVSALAKRGVPEAIEQIRMAGRRIGQVLAGIVNLLNPDVIRVWGYLAEPEDHLFAGIRESLAKHALPMSSEVVVLGPTQLRDDAGIRGASMLVVERMLTDDEIEQRLDQFVKCRGQQVADD